jgi:uncharacterized membrane protein
MQWPILYRSDEISPGVAERILVMAEKEQVHRHRCDMATLLGGWSITVAFSIGAVVAAAFDQPTVGVALAAGSATGMAGPLVTREVARRQVKRARRRAGCPLYSRPS